MTAAVLNDVRTGSVECASLLPTVATLRKWESANTDLAFHYVKPAASDRRVRVYVRRIDG